MMRRRFSTVSLALAVLVGGIGAPTLAQEADLGMGVAAAAENTTRPSLLARMAGLLVAPSKELDIRRSGLLRTTAIDGDEPGADADPLEFLSFQTMVDELGSMGVRPERITVAKWWAEDAHDQMVFVGQGIRVPDADTAIVLDAFLSWVTHACCPEIDGIARVDPISFGGSAALAISFSGDGYEDVEYVLASGDAVIWLDADAMTAKAIFAALA